MRARVSVRAFVATSVVSLTATANPADIFGFGSRSSALGGAVSAGVSDASANYYNPAGLVWSNHTLVSAGIVHVTPQLQQDGSSSGVGGVTAWQLGLVVPGDFWGLPVAFGLAAQVSGRRIARVVTFTEDDQRWFLYEHRPEQLFLVSNLALRLTRGLSVGGGFGFLASTDGLLRITGELQQPVAGASEFDSQLEHEVVAELSNVRYPNLAARLHVHEDIDLALVYRGEGSVTLDVDSEIAGNIHLGRLALPTRYLLFSKTVQSWIPRQLTLGARWTPRLDFEAGLDFTWVDWSGLPSPVSATNSELSLDTRGALIPIPALPPATELTQAHARDRLNARLGFELRPRWAPLPWRARAGYAYQPSGLGTDSSPNLLDADAHVFSVGCGVDLLRWKADAQGRLVVDAHAQWGQLSERTQRGPAGQTTSLTGHWVAGSLQLTLEL